MEGTALSFTLNPWDSWLFPEPARASLTDLGLQLQAQWWSREPGARAAGEEEGAAASSLRSPLGVSAFSEHLSHTAALEE